MYDKCEIEMEREWNQNFNSKEMKKYEFVEIMQKLSDFMEKFECEQNYETCPLFNEKRTIIDSCGLEFVKKTLQFFYYNY